MAARKSSGLYFPVPTNLPQVTLANATQGNVLLTAGAIGSTRSTCPSASHAE